MFLNYLQGISQNYDAYVKWYTDVIFKLEGCPKV